MLYFLFYSDNSDVLQAAGLFRSELDLSHTNNGNKKPNNSILRKNNNLSSSLQSSFDSVHLEKLIGMVDKEIWPVTVIHNVADILHCLFTGIYKDNIIDICKTSNRSNRCDYLITMLQHILNQNQN